jgi:mono/diheme cytochrome c family protein
MLLALLGLGAVGCGTATDPAPEAHVYTGLNSTSTRVADASRGGALFFQDCASCHGADGHGGFGPDLVTSPVSRDARQVYEQVVQGRGRMPGFAGVLTRAQIVDVTSYVTDVLARPLPLQGAAAPLPPAATKASQLQAPAGIDPRSGRVVYRQDCAGCHAPDGSGGPLAPPLSEHPVAYAALIELLVDGNLQHGMPSFQRLLGSGEMARVAAYVDEILIRGSRPSGAHGRGGVSSTTVKG